MLGRIRGARVDRKTAIVVLVLALVVWAMVTYVKVRDFVPDELTESTPSSQP